MQVDFYHLTREPAEKLLPAICEKSLAAGKRLLLVSGDEAQLELLDRALWEWRPDSFLAHDRAGAGGEEHQPILLCDTPQAANRADYIALADGLWREEALGFERVFYFFSADHLDMARESWRALDRRADVSPRYWKQQGGGWVEGP